MKIDAFDLNNTIETLQRVLLESKNPAGRWEGYLSSSALSTATAVFALATVDREQYNQLIEKGLTWLCENQNCDGGWGDTTNSISNISTTMLCYCTFAIRQDNPKYAKTIEKTQSWLLKQAESLDAKALANVIDSNYGSDKSFSAPILTMCALSGRLGDDKNSWKYVKSLPFELALLPHQFYKLLRLPVVSYALPALIAIGLAKYHHSRPRNPFACLIRLMAHRRVLGILQKLQPENGGFLEATPLTAFVVLSLAGSGIRENSVVTRGVDFLVKSIRNDGSWPIDTNLASWVTTLSLDALASGGKIKESLPATQQEQILKWLLESQHRRIHPYTHAEPGGWAWTNLAGTVPDADDTSGVLLALRNLDYKNNPSSDVISMGIQWLLNLQNSDGGMPTFCRGWSNLPFDRSTPDITSHALAAISVWQETLHPEMQQHAKKAITRGIEYLRYIQNENGSWIPLWFGNQLTQKQENPVYGTAKAMSNLLKMPESFHNNLNDMLSKAGIWLLSVQNPDGSWGGDKNIAGSIEETSLAVDALAESILHKQSNPWLSGSEQQIKDAVLRAIPWLITKTEKGKTALPAPIGLYFARLWYYEKLYPIIFCLAALKKVQRILPVL
jgi:squalene-hopene/tetraprenyl-beta-curcumene cyclase